MQRTGAAVSWCAAIALTIALSGSAHAQSRVLSPSEANPDQVQKINQFIRQGWADYEISPSPREDDDKWCRRVFIDILGRAPSYQELTEFLGSKSSQKRAELVDSLLYDEKYVEEYARNWTTIWTNILIGRTGGTERNSLINRAGMQKFLRDSFARNKPYDRMVYELVTAEGHNTPGNEKFNGAVNFLIGKLEEDGTLATAETSKVFLGRQVQCTQCHNHPFNEWKQRKFWEMNAFFRQTVALRRFQPGTRDIIGAELANQDFGGISGDPEEAEIFYELRNGEMKVAYPTFIDDTEIARSGFISDVNRRDELGKLIVKSPYLAEAMVNRTWGHFMGHAFTKPMDDLGPHNPPTHPDLLAYLGEEFAKERYNVKELIRWVVLSEPYQLSSAITVKNKIDDPEIGETPKFSRYYMRQLSAEQLYETLLVATQAHKTRGSYEEQEKAKSEWLQQFVTAFGTDEGGEATTFNGSIPQALMMFNGDLIKKATDGSQGSFLWTVANSKLSNRQKIDYLFLAALARKPSAQEVQMANKLLIARRGNAVEALQDMWWALLNSNEFIMNH